MRSILFIIILFSSWLVRAQEIFPNGCLPVVIDNDLVTLAAEKYAFVVLHNLSKNDLWIIHPANDDGSQAAWISKIQSDKWSSLVLNKQASELTFSCIESRPGHEQKINCRDVLAICSWPNASVPDNRKGIFWLAEDMDMLPLTAYIERLGFKLG